MKIRFAATLLIIVFCASLFYGCGLIQISQEKDLAQVIAVVGDDEYKDEILKKDLADLFMQQGSQYIQNYGLTVKQTMEILLEQLINNRIVIQQGAKALIDKNSLDGSLSDYLSPEGKKKSDGIKLLVGNEVYQTALGNVYKYEKDMLDYYEEQIKKEEDPDATPEPTPEPTPTPRPTPTPPDGEPTATPHPSNPPIEDESETRQKAFERIKADLKKNDKDMTYEKFFEENLVNQLENEIINLYREYLYEDIRVDKDKMQLRFDNMLSQQKQHYSIDLSAAQTKLENAGDDTFVLYNPLEGYGYVKNLLISFDDVLSDQLKEYQNLDRSKEQYLAKRAELLDGIIVKDLTDGLDEEDREYGDISKFYDEIIKLSDYSGTDIAGYDNLMYKISENDFDDYVQYFVDLIFQYGSDPGMFNNTIDYLASPKSETGQEKYVKEFAEASRDVIKEGEGSIALVGTDYGWHILLCTEVLQAGSEEFIEDDIYDQITLLLDNGTEFEDVDKSIRDTFTYKLYKLMREEKKSARFNNTIESIIDSYEKDGKIEKFEKAYKDYMEM